MTALTEVLGQTGRTTPSRLVVLEVLRSSPDALTVDEIAAAVGLGASAVRAHLGALVDAGAVVRTSVYSRRRGRPRARFSAAGTDRAPVQALDIGRAVARSIFAWPDLLEEHGGDLASALCALFEHQGFDARLAADASAITLHSCPYAPLFRGEETTVCALHAGLIAGAVEAAEQDVVDVVVTPLARPGVCEVRLHRAPDVEA